MRAQKMTEKIMSYWDWRQTAKRKVRIFYYRFLLNFIWNNRFLLQFI